MPSHPPSVFRRCAAKARSAATSLAAWPASRIALAASLVGFAAFGAALALQHAMGLDPCPLCIFQRVAVLSSSLALLAASFACRKSARFGLAGLAVGAALAAVGLAIALKHMHVMWVPQDVSCGPDLEYLMEAFPPTKWLPKVFAGEAECAAAARQLVLWLPIPVWSALLFALQIAASAAGWAKLWAARKKA